MLEKRQRRGMIDGLEYLVLFGTNFEQWITYISGQRDIIGFVMKSMYIHSY